MTMMEMTGHNTAPCGAPRTGILGEDASLSMQTTAPLLLRNAADQRSVPLRIDSRRVPKMMLSWSTVSRALARSTRQPLCGVVGHRGAGGPETQQRVKDEIDGPAARCLQGRLGPDGALNAFSPGLRRGVTAPRRQFRGTVPACSRLLGGRERHASPHGPGGAEPLHVFSQRQAPAPWATVMGWRLGPAVVIRGEAPRIRQYRWRRAGL
ncbi:hypothetical protein TcYC6_0023350 [Trypanosoma cruzi]|nr:hypothetical protein TcYC6_0023350 [Trypanosoma cruzi]